jgi:hypothetical protein
MTPRTPEQLLAQVFLEPADLDADAIAKRVAKQFS